jgi:hypothetical protein
MEAICDEIHAANPDAWFELEMAGLTREVIRKTVEAGEWLGPPPLFEKAPDRSGAMWRHLTASHNADLAAEAERD